MISLRKAQIIPTGIDWTQSNKTNGSGIRYSDTEVITAKNAYEKYLDQNGVQEIVTQFKAYCNNLVGGA